jgi:transposase
VLAFEAWLFLKAVVTGEEQWNFTFAGKDEFTQHRMRHRNRTRARRERNKPRAAFPRAKERESLLQGWHRNDDDDSLSKLHQQMEVGFYAKQEPRLRGQHDALKQRKDLYPHSSESVRRALALLTKTYHWKSGYWTQCCMPLARPLSSQASFSFT